MYVLKKTILKYIAYTDFGHRYFIYNENTLLRFPVQPTSYERFNLNQMLNFNRAGYIFQKDYPAHHK